MSDLKQSANLTDWCAGASTQLESLFLRGALSLAQYRALADAALSLALRCEAGSYQWGLLEASEMFDSAVALVIQQRQWFTQQKGA